MLHAVEVDKYSGERQILYWEEFLVGYPFDTLGKFLSVRSGLLSELYVDLLLMN